MRMAFPNGGFIDKTGKLVIPAIYYADEKHFWNKPRFREGLAHVSIGDEVNHQYGFIDKQGNWKIRPQFRDAGDFRDGYAQVQLGSGGFDKNLWNKNRGGFFMRSEQFDFFVKQNGLIGMSRKAVLEAAR